MSSSTARGRSSGPGPHRRTLLLVVVLALLVPLMGRTDAVGQEVTPPPNTFGLRLEGFAVETLAQSTSTAVQPRSAYSYAKVSSFLDLDGGRGLDMEARGANDQYQGFEGAVIFDGGTPTDGNNLPGYTQAFFPAFEGFSTVSEKCAFNQTEAKETPECRDQDGPYALALVVPDADQPSATGIGRNQGEDDGRGDARSSSRVEPQPDGSILGTQSNSGSDQGVPGTPIMVDSFVAEQTVRTTIGSATTDIRCEGEVSLAGQKVTNNKELQQALAPLTIGGDLRVEFEPASEPEITQLAGGALEASCRGPRFTVYSSPQGGTATRYTYGHTFAAVGITDNRDPGGGFGEGGVIGPPLPEDEPAPAPSEPTASGSTGAPAPPTSPTPTSSPPPVEPTPDEPSLPFEDDGSPRAAPQLVREDIDTLAIGVFTGVAAGLLPLAVWLLLGVTGSLARGLPTLRLPPFHS